MSWISIIEYEQATGTLKRLYDRVKGPKNYIDNILKVHSLRPHSLKGHMALYKNVLHHRDNSFPKWLLESLGVYVSLLNGCAYCVAHHFAGLRRLLADDQRAYAYRTAMENNSLEAHFDGRELALLNYARQLTLEPAALLESDVENLRQQGLDDGEILEANQVISYFCYANRTVLGLGVNTVGDVLGLSPGDNDAEENWQHG